MQFFSSYSFSCRRVYCFNNNYLFSASFCCQIHLSLAPGISINLLFIIAGAFIVYNKDIRKEPNWIGNYSTDSTGILATIKEPLIEKAKTYKAEASVEAVNIEGEWKVVSGNILIYFSKDSSLPEINYGSQVVFYKPLQRIKNSGNPGSFDYDQYCAFQNIYHQIFLKSNEYQITKQKMKTFLKNGCLMFASGL